MPRGASYEEADVERDFGGTYVYFKPNRFAVVSRLRWNGNAWELVKETNVVIGRDKISVKPESLILAQNERWRQA